MCCCGSKWKLKDLNDIELLRAAHQSSGECAGRCAVCVNNFAVHDGGDVAFGALDDAAASAGQVVNGLGRVQVQAVEIQHVYVGLVAGL